MAAICPPVVHEAIAFRLREQPGAVTIDAISDGPLTELTFTVPVGGLIHADALVLVTTERQTRNALLDTVRPSEFMPYMRDAATDAWSELHRNLVGAAERSAHAAIAWNFRRVLQGLLCVMLMEHKLWREGDARRWMDGVKARA